MNVTQRLGQVNYSKDFNYTPSNFAIKFINTLKLINGDRGEANVTPVMHYKMLDTLMSGSSNIANLCYRGSAKLQSASSKILTPDGWTTIGKIAVGDEVINRYGKRVRVKLKTDPQYPQMYLMKLSDGTVLEVGDEHRHIVVSEHGIESVQTTLELLGKEDRYSIPLVSPIDFPKKAMAVSPYALGRYLMGNPDAITESEFSSDFNLCLWGSIDQRTALLQGCLDKQSTYSSSGEYHVTTPNPIIQNYLTQLIQSLGGYVEQFTRHLQFRLSLENSNIRPNGASQGAKLVKGILSIEPVEIDEEGYCIAVDSDDQSYVTEGYTVTHNTTVMCEYLCLYLALYGELDGFGKVPLVLYVSDSMENGVKNFHNNLKAKYNNSAFLQTYLDLTKGTTSKTIFTNKDGRTFTVNGYGAQTGLRGVREGDDRPIMALLDDLVGDQDAKSPTVIANIEDTVYKAVTYALDPSRNKTIWSGTPYNARDPLYKAVESGAWEVNIFPVCEQFPCEPEEFRGAWEDRFPYSYVNDQYIKATKTGMLGGFNQELMLRIISDEERLVQESDIRWYFRDELLREKHSYNFYITTDFATLGGKGDFSVISIWAYSSIGSWYWVDGLCEKQTMDKNVDALFYYVQKYKPQSVGIEVTGQQGGFVSLIEQQMVQRNSHFHFASEGTGGRAGINPKSNKDKHFDAVLPLFKAGKIHFPEELRSSPIMLEAMNELSLITPSGMRSKYDDFIDTISMLSDMKPWRPSDTPQPSMRSDSIWGFHEEEPLESSYNSYLG